MTVILNEAALAILLDSEQGPVGRFIEEKAAQVMFQAQTNVDDYFGSAPSLDVGGDVGFSMEGSTATIGIRDAGAKSRRYARYESEGRIRAGLKEALEAARF